MELTEFYVTGAREKDGKMSAVQIREALFDKYPSRHDIQIERQITYLISNLGGM